jgi:NAD(P)-dependent dehydrogenase (short-subunit alcohol dehydrogenase family)
MYAQSREEAEVVARELTSRRQIDAAAFACDITDGAAVERVVGEVTGRFGRLDILVNDAAYNKSVDALTSEGPIGCFSLTSIATQSHIEKARAFTDVYPSRPRGMQASSPPGGRIPGYCSKFQRAQ